MSPPLTFDDEGLKPDGKQSGYSRSGVMVSGDYNTKLAMQYEFDIAGIYTVEFSLVNLGTVIPGADPVQKANAAQAPIRAEALIAFTVEGNELTRRVSVGNGVSISGAAQAIRVEIQDTTDQVQDNGFGVLLFKNIQYQVSMNIVKGARAMTSVPPRLNVNPRLSVQATTLNPSPGPGNTVAYLVPPDAGVSSVHVTCGGVGNQVIPDQTVQVIHVGYQTQKSYEARSVDWEPVETGTSQITIQNNSTTLSPIVNLTFGIDG